MHMHTHRPTNNKKNLKNGTGHFLETASGKREIVTSVSHESTSHFTRHAEALTTNATTLKHSK